MYIHALTLIEGAQVVNTPALLCDLMVRGAHIHFTSAHMLQENIYTYMERYTLNFQYGCVSIYRYMHLCMLQSYQWSYLHVSMPGINTYASIDTCHAYILWCACIMHRCMFWTDRGMVHLHVYMSYICLYAVWMYAPHLYCTLQRRA